MVIVQLPDNNIIMGRVTGTQNFYLYVVRFLSPCRFTSDIDKNLLIRLLQMGACLFTIMLFYANKARPCASHGN